MRSTWKSAGSLDQAYEVARVILSRRRMALEDLATLLIERETLDAADLQAVLDRHPIDLSTVTIPGPRATLMPPPRQDIPPFRADHHA